MTCLELIQAWDERGGFWPVDSLRSLVSSNAGQFFESAECVFFFFDPGHQLIGQTRQFRRLPPRVVEGDDASVPDLLEYPFDYLLSAFLRWGLVRPMGGRK